MSRFRFKSSVLRNGFHTWRREKHDRYITAALSSYTDTYARRTHQSLKCVTSTVVITLDNALPCLTVVFAESNKRCTRYQGWLEWIKSIDLIDMNLIHWSIESIYFFESKTIHWLNQTKEVHKLSVILSHNWINQL